MNNTLIERMRKTVAAVPLREKTLPPECGGIDFAFKTTSVADIEYAIGIVGKEASDLRYCIALFVTKALNPADKTRIFSGTLQEELEVINEIAGWSGSSKFFPALMTEMATLPVTVEDTKNALGKTGASGSGSSSPEN